MAAASFQDAFSGKVEQNEYTQVHDFEFVPNYYTVDGVQYVTSFTRNLVTVKVTEKTYRFMGLNYANAHTETTQSVKDAANNTHSVPMASGFRDGSSGSRVFEVYSCTVQREPISPRLWAVTVRVRGSAYYLNGKLIVS